MIDPDFLALPLQPLAAAALERAQDLGAEHADVRIERITGQLLRLRDGTVATAQDSTTVGLAVRVIVEGTWGFASHLELTPASAVATAQRAVEVARTLRVLNAERVELATEPVQYLFVPRVIAGIVMLPFLVILGDALGIGGGYLVAVKLLGANAVVYQQNTFQFLGMKDLWTGVIKAGTFGLILTLTGCVRGYYTSGGAEGVGRSTTQAVVSASLIILLTDFFLTKMLQ